MFRGWMVLYDPLIIAYCFIAVKSLGLFLLQDFFPLLLLLLFWSNTITTTTTTTLISTILYLSYLILPDLFVCLSS